jgi:hypothetical protein
MWLLFQHTEASLEDLKPPEVVVPVNTNLTEAEWLEILAEQTPRPEKTFEFQNNSEPQPGNICYCRYRVQLVYNIMTRTEYFVSLETSVIITE